MIFFASLLVKKTNQNTQIVLVNGLACKDPKTVEAADFSFCGLHLEGNTSNPIGSSVTPVTVFQLPGLNTLGISLVRIDYAPSGVNPPHTHPRASEIITVLEGSLEVGFVTSSPEYRHITKVLQKGDVCFPHWTCALSEKCRIRSCCCYCSSQQPKSRCDGNCQCCVWVQA
ncbi:putative germin-like protein 2-1 [Prunus yedoensis var. nudiflora]|uniref:Putative germin-like protein 2-1 n=1 Tax=Prunus yedoensis var. nudiflora TaxID=2094558 RepID=A0A314UJT9_PRUYE|nr:putative germin-like protein 2-1 [Prunus yedoensis var. nudiflora]